ncbi:hypothetical protein HPB47_017952 [Ixodes persulcatus]|uniref:Uncharacterized protein n=1 Tax=Ixodes persulcatus TaxID=34615 RepID=A0AC60QLZ4_IXOPE|nr:hypothetical protein HPB47_017952 [Ixodes persulcatus]
MDQIFSIWGLNFEKGISQLNVGTSLPVVAEVRPASAATVGPRGNTMARRSRTPLTLEAYGHILEITHGVYKDNPSVKTGTRYMKMKMKENNRVHNFTRIAGYCATFDYRSLVRVCRRCKKEGHFKAQYTAEYCSRCATLGHDGTTCTESGRRCGARHATIDCTKTMMDFPQLATRSTSSSMAQEGHEGGSSVAPMQPLSEKVTSAATSASEPDQSLTQPAHPPPPHRLPSKD